MRIKGILSGFNDAIQELYYNTGAQFDPKLVDAFVSNIDESYLEGM